MAYNEKIVIQQYTQARDDYGAIDAGSWADYKTVWAEVSDAGGSLSHESDQPVYEDSTSFKFRTFDAPGVTSKMRVSYDSQVWVIRNIQKEARLVTNIIAEAYDDE